MVEYKTEGHVFGVILCRGDSEGGAGVGHSQGRLSNRREYVPEGKDTSSKKREKMMDVKSGP